jgi:hypothetical protein
MLLNIYHIFAQLVVKQFLLTWWLVYGAIGSNTKSYGNWKNGNENNLMF